jgi:hypothetical protein
VDGAGGSGFLGRSLLVVRMTTIIVAITVFVITVAASGAALFGAGMSDDVEKSIEVGKQAVWIFIAGVTLSTIIAFSHYLTLSWRPL